MQTLRRATATCRGAAFVVLLLSAMGPGQSAASGQAATQPGAATDAQRCAALTGADFDDLPEAPTRISSARLVDVGPGMGVLSASPIKQYCQVLGYVAPQNKFELRLPLPSQWNQKFHLTPCAGFCGTLNGNVCNATLARGYASITGNGGHDGPGGFDGVWAANSPNLQEDFGWRHNHVVTIAGKAITTKFYGQAIARSYMSGCSKGGHAALLEAQRFPADFDGIVPGAPVYDIVGRTIAAAWFTQAVDDGRGMSVLDAAASGAVNRSVLQRCGAQAGVDEGLVTDPASCDWRPEMAACASGQTGTTCLTPRQVEAVRRLMSPVVNDRGEVLYAFPSIPGTETEWYFWLYAGGDAPPPGAYANHMLTEQFFRFMADEKARAGVDPLKFDFNREPSRLSRARKIYDATSFDLRAFKARGGKVVMWHGLADAAIMATSSIAYYQGVEKLMGGRAPTQDFFRLFLIPGLQHCAGGPGLTDFDALTLLENWVEKDQAPDVLMASRSAKGVVERTRPVYPYPLLARYSGQGDARQASSFGPHDPSRR
jgi:hypothetical protein